jgi:ubiquinone/menaquinone biosynthesis C-methylase UbiE
MELEDIIAVNELFIPIYPYLARHIAQEYGRKDGQALEIGPYGPGISLELAKLLPELSIIVGDDSAAINAYLKRKIDEAELAERISVKEIDKYHLPISDESLDLVYFRGALFFWPDNVQIVKEAYRVLKAGGLAMLGGGLGADTPEELVREIVPRSRELNRRLSKAVLAPEDAKMIMEQVGVVDKARLDTRRGLWIIVRK